MPRFHFGASFTLTLSWWSSSENTVLPGFNNNPQKIENLFLTKFGFSKLSRVNPVPKQINKGLLKKKINTSYPMQLDVPSVPVC